MIIKWSYILSMSAGGVATMVAGSEQSQAVRIATFSMLQFFLHLQTGAKVTATLTLLARMNGVRQISSLLCPDFASMDEDEYPLGMQKFQPVMQVNHHAPDGQYVLAGPVRQHYAWATHGALAIQILRYVCCCNSLHPFNMCHSDIQNVSKDASQFRLSLVGEQPRSHTVM